VSRHGGGCECKKCMTERRKRVFAALMQEEPTMTVRAKMCLQSITEETYRPGSSSKTLNFSACYDTTIPEDQRFQKATPSASAKFQIDGGGSYLTIQYCPFCGSKIPTTEPGRARQKAARVPPVR